MFLLLLEICLGTRSVLACVFFFCFFVLRRLAAAHGVGQAEAAAAEAAFMDPPLTAADVHAFAAAAAHLA